ncbi:MAG: DUF2799 domain-containing protein [Rhizobiaceae bacterium]|nr:DUF2799 domain-containing protein [Rhizobiaceae bacterium]
MKTSRIFAPGILLALPMLAACQTLSKEECVAADWRVIGEQDGAQGHDPQSRFGRHVQACEKAGIIPDQTLWNAGYQVGVRRFCTPTNGLAHGQRGGSYNNICPADQAGLFDEGYRLGFREHAKRREIDSLSSQIRSARFSSDQRRKEISEGKIDQIEGERIIRENEFRINGFNREIGRKEIELEQIQREVEDFRFRQQNRING